MIHWAEIFQPTIDVANDNEIQLTDLNLWVSRTVLGINRMINKNMTV